MGQHRAMRYQVMMSSILRQISGMLGICLLAATAAQAVPQKISYQGSLSDQIGQPVDGTLAMTFRLYTVPTGGSELWSETQSVQIVNGLFSVELGAQNLIPEDTFFGEEVYLGVQVGADSEMVPRQQLNAVGYSLNSPAGQIPVPIGTVLPWVKNLAGVPALPVGWLECNGQVVADSQSPLDGETLPDLNGGRLSTERKLDKWNSRQRPHAHLYERKRGGYRRNPSGLLYRPVWFASPLRDDSSRRRDFRCRVHHQSQVNRCQARKRPRVFGQK